MAKRRNIQPKTPISEELLKQHAAEIVAEWPEGRPRWFMIISKVMAAQKAGIKGKNLKLLAQFMGRAYSTLKRLAKIGHDANLLAFIEKYKDRFSAERWTVLEQLRLIAENPEHLRELEINHFAGEGSVILERKDLRKFRRDRGLLPPPKPRKTIIIHVGDLNTAGCIKLAKLISDAESIPSVRPEVSDWVEEMIKKAKSFVSADRTSKVH